MQCFLDMGSSSEFALSEVLVHMRTLFKSCSLFDEGSFHLTAIPLHTLSRVRHFSGTWQFSSPSSFQVDGDHLHQPHTAYLGQTHCKPTQTHLKIMKSWFSCYQLFLSTVAVYWCSQGQNQNAARAVCEIEGGNKDRKKELQTQPTPKHLMQESQRLAQNSKLCLQRYPSSLM